jgi:hypothetical protein
MKKIIRLAAAALAFGLSFSVASAATFNGEFWDADVNLGNLGSADAIIAAGPATATFQSTGINYTSSTGGSVSSGSTLNTFLGADAASLSGSGTSTLTRSVFRFTGLLNLAAGPQQFSVGSDDGFRLTIGGVEIATAGNRGFATTSATRDLGAGLSAFELIFYENGGSTGVNFSINGALAAPAAIPLPASLPLMLLGLGALGAAMRRRKTAA